MKKHGCSTLLLVGLLFGAGVNTAVASPDKAHRVLIITKGKGGDANGAAALIAEWPRKKADLVNLSDIPPNLIDAKKYSCILLIGQGAVGEMLLGENRKNLLTVKKIGMYSHLIDAPIMQFLKEEHTRPPNVFFLKSQIFLLRFKDLALFKKLSQMEDDYLWSTSLAIRSTRKMMRNSLPAHSPFLEMDNVIWLGGNYTTSSGSQRILSDQEILDSLRNLHNTIKPGSSVALMLMPRLFKPNANREDKLILLTEIASIYSDTAFHFYANALMADELNTVKTPIHEAPSYDELMTLPWWKTQHFASADQYNLFSDLNADAENVAPFLLDPSDAEQALYAINFINKKDSRSMLQEILSHGCKGLHTQ
ncbi:hypothetical protein [Pseudomonas fluorescens]|uniref:Uncharacterized protein n=1 Tax=Pseudomonas fluorescens TaxID=294 RepID=A0A5E7C6J7_PSEFL|nr:hypothetical protein [Pseudomonas fluorescens]VVO00210.1 hypothetical protein PS691_02569 [Pseudomonas fluorescens]